MKVRVSSLSDIGRSREENQDTLLVDEQACLFIVADGMGGLEGGTLAARYAVKEIAEQFRNAMSGYQHHKSTEITGVLQDAIEAANVRLRESVGNAAGSTVVLAYLTGRKAYVAGLGDSPAYLLRDGSLRRLTKLQNLAELMLETGKITPEQARTHPMRHRLTAYLGMEGKTPATITQVSLRHGDRLLLCTDGLTTMVEERAIAATLAGETDTEAAVTRLVAMANQAGGLDNITVLLLDIEKSRGRVSR